jgi:RNA polymerase-interacting CarD/CdnL/TRCF family regulator
METDVVYSVNDWVVHSRYGVGQVKGVEVKPLQGEPTECFKVKTKECTYWFPANDSDNPRIRPVATEDIILKVIRNLRRKASNLDTDRKYWKKEIEIAYNEGDMLSISKLIRDLSAQKENAMETLKERLTREWAAITRVDYADIQHQLENALQVSVDKINIEG